MLKCEMMKAEPLAAVILLTAISSYMLAVGAPIQQVYTVRPSGVYSGMTGLSGGVGTMGGNGGIGTGGGIYTTSNCNVNGVSQNGAPGISNGGNPVTFGGGGTTGIFGGGGTHGGGGGGTHGG
jgi:hypothetical protein